MAKNPSIYLWCCSRLQVRSSDVGSQEHFPIYTSLKKKSIYIRKAVKINRQILKLFRRGLTYPWLASSEESTTTQASEFKQLPAHLARTAWCCPSRCTVSYLHECVEKLSHIFEATTGKLVEFQPGESSLDNPVVQVNVRLGLDKAFNNKRSQPD